MYKKKSLKDRILGKCREAGVHRDGYKWHSDQLWDVWGVCVCVCVRAHTCACKGESERAICDHFSFS